MPKYVLTVTLNPALDRTVFLARFAPGREFYSRDVLISAGGKGVNVSRTLKNLGLKTLASGFLPGPDFAGFSGLLDRETIKHDFFKVNGRLRHNMTLIAKNHCRPTRILETGQTMLITQNQLNGLAKKLLKLFRKAECVVFSGSVPENVPYDYLARLVSAAKHSGLPVLVDARGKALFAAIKAQPYLIKPNREELGQLTGRPLSSIGQICRSYGLKIALTLAQKGALLADGRMILKAEVPRVKPANTVGCGDAFMAGLIKGMVEGADESAMLRLAAACGTAAATSYIPADIDKPRLRQIYRKVRITRAA